jgi:glycerate-2-kinase
MTLLERLVLAGRAALVAEHGEALVRAALRERPSRARRVVAVGKAAPAMAAGSDREGLIVCKDAASVLGFRTLVAGHPVPDERSVAATRAVLSEVAALGEDDELLLLVSGGTSALLGGPVDGVPLAALRALTQAALKGGLAIDELNCLRRRVGAALGGRLGAATRASIRALVISDVASDDPRVIGSGPVSMPPSDDAERATALAARLGLDPALREQLRTLSSPPPRDRVDITILANPRSLLAAAERALAARGFGVEAEPTLAAGPVEDLVERLRVRAEQLAPGTAFLMVGEPTVRVRGTAPGGRAQHVALSALPWLGALGDRALLALGSDGSDGPTDAAGAAVDAASSRAAGDVGAAIAACDSHRVLGEIGALIRTGPTGTNLTDLYVVAR